MLQSLYLASGSVQSVNHCLFVTYLSAQEFTRRSKVKDAKISLSCGLEPGRASGPRGGERRKSNKSHCESEGRLVQVFALVSFRRPCQSPGVFASVSAIVVVGL